MNHCFQSKFNKSYKDNDEEEYRKGIYKESKINVEEHNKKHAAGEVTFTMGINQFADLTAEEHSCKFGLLPQNK